MRLAIIYINLAMPRLEFVETLKSVESGPISFIFTRRSCAKTPTRCHPVPPGATLYHPLTSQGTPAPPAAMTRKSPQWLAHLNQKENIQKKTCNEIKPGTEEKLQPDYKSQFKAFEYLSIFSLGLSVSLKRRRKGKARLEAGAILS